MASKKRGAKRAKKSARRKGVSLRKARPKRVMRTQRRVVRKIARKTTRRRSSPQRKPVRAMRQAATLRTPTPTLNEKEIGHISHFFSGIDVGILEVTKGPVRQGDRIHIKGETTDFIQKIGSMQFDHQPVSQAESGKSVGIKVDQRVRQHDRVYLAK